MLKDLFKRSQYVTIPRKKLNSSDELENEFVKDQKPNIPTGMWQKCSNCSKILYKEDLENNNKICTNCGFHFKIGAMERINILCDKDSFEEMFIDIEDNNPLKFPEYEEKLNKNKEMSGISEAVVTGTGNINNCKVALAVMDSYFMMGSMGSVVGEKITLLVEYATNNRLPLIICTASGGARMQEGIFSLMQMAKISSAIAKHDTEGLLYLTIITNPTTGGVTASFAMEGDIIISEPNALIAFAGRRVIENTIKEKLPDYFQTAEFAKDKGFVDAIVSRNDMKKYIFTVLKLHGVNSYE